MYDKHSNLVDANTSDARASIKHLESRLEVIQGHTLCHYWKPDEGLRITV